MKFIIGFVAGTIMGMALGIGGVMLAMLDAKSAEGGEHVVDGELVDRYQRRRLIGHRSVAARRGAAVEGFLTPIRGASGDHQD